MNIKHYFAEHKDMNIKKLFDFTTEKKSFTLDESKDNYTPPRAPYPAISENIEENLKVIKEIFSADLSCDIKIREFYTGNLKAFIVFIENLVMTEVINENILAPLMLFKNKDISYEKIKDTLLVLNQLSEADTFEKVAESVNLGDCVLFVDGCSKVFTCDVKSWARRGIDSPITESVIYGPHEAFIENYKTNISLVRKNLRREELICESINVGKVSQTPCGLLYIDGITNKALIKEIKRRLNNINADYVFQAGELEQFIEDSTFSLMPQMLTTERPDKCANALVEGKVVLLLHGSPFALICPVTFAEFLTTVEDRYIRFPFAGLMKIIRIIGILCSFLLPGLYISVINFHQEMIPTDLLFAIEASRESVPFPALVELLIMEIAFDVIREASIRVPSSIGSTLGIIGALIIGDAAVSANLVSPIAIIIVAVTGIGSYATPSYSLNMCLRYLRYFYIILGSVMGFFGIAFGLFINAASLCATNSLGVSMFEAMANDGKDNILRILLPFPIWKRELRHKFLNPEKMRVQDKISRGWDK